MLGKKAKIPMTEVSYDWLNLVEKALTSTQQLPPLEENFPFPWADASQAISTGLQLSLNLTSTRAEWKEPEKILQGLGDKPFFVEVEISPIEGSVFFAMSEQDVAYLTAQALTSGEGFNNLKLREGFYHFLFLKAIEAVDHLQIFKEVSFHFSPVSTVPAIQESAFCIDISCALPEKNLQGRLICPASFVNSFKANQPLQKTTLLAPEVNQDIEVTLRCEVGYTFIPQEDWEKAQVGDFILMDRCSYDPVEEKGSITLMLGDTPLLMARMKPEGMKILDYAFYQEKETPSTSSDILLTAESGRMQMPLSKLLHLEPGMMIDLPMRPAQGVDITLEGSKVAAGELLKVGEASGLRLLEK